MAKKELSINDRLVGVRAGMNGIARRVNARLDSLTKLEDQLNQNATVLAIFRTCIEDIRREMGELVSKPEEE